MQRTTARTADDLMNEKGSICFVFDSCGLISSEQEDDVLECLMRLRNPLDTMDAGIIPQLVMGEIDGLQRNPQKEDIAERLLQGPLKGLPQVKAMVKGWSEPSGSKKSCGSLAVQDFGASWKLLDSFARSNDTHILSCACFYRGFEGGVKRPTEELTTRGLGSVQRVVMVTTDQVMGIKATATYDIETITPEDFVRVFRRLDNAQ